MNIWGLHILDLSIIILYVIVILWLGKRVAGRTKNTDDFFLAGRKLGKFYQFFLNFGCSTNADQAVAVSREVYRQGIGGMWIQFVVLFLTPFYWFTTLLFRRVRLTTIGDFFRERFNSQFLAASYAVFILLLSVLGGGIGYMVAAKTMMAMTPKPIELLSPREQASVAQFRELKQLKADLQNGLTPAKQLRYTELKEKEKRGGLKSFISYTEPVWFYFIYAAIVAIYTMMGGFRAAAITDAIQGVLIIIFSAILIPVGLTKIGGFSGLHASVPDFMFELFGSATLSDYAWYTIFAMAFANLVSIIAVVSGMQTAGSATNEMTARFGMIAGMFAKRIIMIFWALAGLLAVGLYAGQLHDPDLIWGYMSRDLLFPGGIGLMLIGILAANMSTLDAGSVSYSALFIRNLYKPFVPDKSERHYLFIGRIAIAVALFGGIAVAMAIDNLLELFKYIISIPAIFGASVWLGFVWRRLTKWAVIMQVAICIVIYTIIPNLFQAMDSVKYNESFLRETNAQIIPMSKDSDGNTKIQVAKTIEPVGIYFDKVARIGPQSGSGRVGLGRFNAEIWIISWFGVDFTGWTKAELVAARFIFDGLFPFILLFIFSIFTKPEPKPLLDRFFAKLHTPVQDTPHKEAMALAKSYSNPGMYDKDKLFPGRNWEILKPEKIDYIGFFGSWVLVGFVILLLWMVVSIK